MNKFFVTLAAFTVATLFAALATPVPLAARQEHQVKPLPHYIVTDLGTLSGTTDSPDTTNARGWVQSASTWAGHDQHALTPLSTLGGNSGEAFGINKHGQVVGA